MNTLKITTPLERVCKTGKIADQFQYIYFKNGKIYVSNGNIHVVQDMALHGMGKKTQDILDGYCIHKYVVKHLKSFKSDITLGVNMSHYSTGALNFIRETKQVTARSMIASTVVSLDLRHSIDIPGKGKLIQHIDKAIEDFKSNPTEKISLVPDSLELISKSFVKKTSGLTIFMNGSKDRILITPNENNYTEMALQMPLVVSADLKKI